MCMKLQAALLNIYQFWRFPLFSIINNRKLSQHKEGCRRRVGRVGRGVRVCTCPSVEANQLTLLSLNQVGKIITITTLLLAPRISQPSYDPKVHYLFRIIDPWRKNDFTKDDLKKFFFCPKNSVLKMVNVLFSAESTKWYRGGGTGRQRCRTPPKIMADPL